MIKKIPGEIWKQLLFPGSKGLRKKYAISNHGRSASYMSSITEDGTLINGSVTTGYRTLNLHVDNGGKTFYIHREVAKLFCSKKSPKAKFVIHLNHNKADNAAKNLKWATPEEVVTHQQKSPLKIAYKKKQANKSVGLKLTITQVKAIKETLKNPKRKLTYKQLSEKYQVSQMTLYRIKSGENWGKVK